MRKGIFFLVFPKPTGGGIIFTPLSPISFWWKTPEAIHELALFEIFVSRRTCSLPLHFHFFCLCWVYSSYNKFNISIPSEGSPRTTGSALGDDWRSAFDAAANGPSDSYSSRSGANGHNRRNSDPSQNGDANSGPNSSSRRTPTRLPPAPPQSGSSYRY